MLSRLTSVARIGPGRVKRIKRTREHNEITRQLSSQTVPNILADAYMFAGSYPFYTAIGIFGLWKVGNLCMASYVEKQVGINPLFFHDVPGYMQCKIDIHTKYEDCKKAVWQKIDPTNIQQSKLNKYVVADPYLFCMIPIEYRNQELCYHFIRSHPSFLAYVPLRMRTKHIYEHCASSRYRIMDIDASPIWNFAHTAMDGKTFNELFPDEKIYLEEDTDPVTGDDKYTVHIANNGDILEYNGTIPSGLNMKSGLRKFDFPVDRYPGFFEDNGTIYHIDKRMRPTYPGHEASTMIPIGFCVDTYSRGKNMRNRRRVTIPDDASIFFHQYGRFVSDKIDVGQPDN